MPRQNFRILLTRRTEHGLQSGQLVRVNTKDPLGYAVVRLVGAQDRLKLPTEDLGIAVSRQAHDFRSVVVREAKKRAEHFPQEADRMRILECFDRLDAATYSLCQRGAGRLAETVDGEDGRAIEAGREIRR